MTRVRIITTCDRLGTSLAERLRSNPGVTACCVTEGPDGEKFDTLVYAPRPDGHTPCLPDLDNAEQVFRYCASLGLRRMVLVSSAAVYGPDCHSPGLLAEMRPACRHRKNAVAQAWCRLEELAAKWLGEETGGTLTILRPASLVMRGTAGPLAGLFHRWLALPLAGYDPSIQLLSLNDLATVVSRVLEAGRAGVYHVAPTAAIPLRQALRLSGVKQFPFPYLLQRLVRGVLARLGLGSPADQLEYLRYPWTIVDSKIAKELDFVPAQSSAEALRDGHLADYGRSPRRWPEFAGQRFDNFGFDPRYFAHMHRTWAHFLEHYYWRMELRGNENLPRSGPAVLVGVHRGFAPCDGFILTHTIAREAGRVPRFLVHPGLVKFPYLARFMTKQGGMIACGANADHVLGHGDMLALYPEGVHGAFRRYRDAYTLASFNRDEYVRMALRHGAPIVPFVTLGTAEIFPILAQLRWPAWQRFTEWPCFPITPTFPLLPPIPLPSKWHTWFLEPIPVARDYRPEAADDKAVVAAIGREVRRRMEDALTWMRSRRRSIFVGSVFDPVDAGEMVPVGNALATSGQEVT